MEAYVSATGRATCSSVPPASSSSPRYAGASLPAAALAATRRRAMPERETALLRAANGTAGAHRRSAAAAGGISKRRSPASPREARGRQARGANLKAQVGCADCGGLGVFWSGRRGKHSSEGEETIAGPNPKPPLPPPLAAAACRELTRPLLLASFAGHLIPVVLRWAPEPLHSLGAAACQEERHGRLQD